MVSAEAPSRGATGWKAVSASAGLFDMAGTSAQWVSTDAAAEQRELAAALRRSYQRMVNYQAAALSEPLTAAALAPLADRGWRIMHDRQCPGSSRANVDHLAIGPGGVAVIDTKDWSLPVQVRDGRLWCGNDDYHEDTVEKILALAGAVEELLIDVSGSDPGLDIREQNRLHLRDHLPIGLPGQGALHAPAHRVDQVGSQPLGGHDLVHRADPLG
ncbi:MAG TPA: nuclease-related domain-containing protein, partial [Pseudonocardia sp.]